jgi:chromosome partitioning protein
LFQVLTGDSAAAAAIVETDYGVDLLPSNPDFAVVESALPSRLGRELVLKQTLVPLTQYDFVLIDTPPNFGFHTLNALAAADYILVPVQMSAYALKGLNEVQRAMTAMRVELNPGLQVLGVLPTFVSPRTNFSYDILSALRALPDLRMFETQVRTTVRFAETSLEGVPILRYATRSSAANAYRKLAGEVLSRTGMEAQSESVLAGLAAASTGSTAKSPAWPGLAPLSSTGALSVDAARLLGLLPEAEAPEDARSATPPEAPPSGIAAAKGPKNHKAGPVAAVMAALRRLTRLRRSA